MLLVLWLGAMPAAWAAPGDVDDGLLVWLRADSGITAADGESVERWEDQSGNDLHASWSPGAPFGELPPVFNASNAQVNGQPTVRFDGEQALALDLTNLIGSDYTIFVVSGRDRRGSNNFYLAGSELLEDRNLVLGYKARDLLIQTHSLNDLESDVVRYDDVPLWSLDAFRFAKAAGRDIRQDGALIAIDGRRTALVANPGTTLGHFRAFKGQFFFTGDMAEIVIYDRALTGQEIVLVEQALAERYGLAIAPPTLTSPFPEEPPTVNGRPFDPIWAITEPLLIRFGRYDVGYLHLANDGNTLYGLMDLVGDPVVNAMGDGWSLVFDLDGNGVPNAGRDLRLSVSGSGDICLATLVGLGVWSDCAASGAQVVRRFIDSPRLADNHRVDEFSIPLAELEARPGGRMFFSVNVESADPPLVYVYPQDQATNYRRAFPLRLSADPDEPPLFGDGFELP